MNVVLVGFMASGKTSVGRRVAKRLGYRFMDTDHFIESEQGTSIAEIFEHGGEELFREMETRLLKKLSRFSNYVFSTGGGIVTTPGNMALLKEMGAVVFLKADLGDIMKRLENDTRRPKLNGGELHDKVTGMLEERLPLYLAADLVVETLGKSPNQVAGEVIRRSAGFKRESAPAEEPPSETSAEPVQPTAP